MRWGRKKKGQLGYFKLADTSKSGFLFVSFFPDSEDSATKIICLLTFIITYNKHQFDYHNVLYIKAFQLLFKFLFQSIDANWLFTFSLLITAVNLWFISWRGRKRSWSQERWTPDPIHHNMGMHLLHAVLYTFPKVLTRRICLIIKSFFSWWSFPLFFRP